MKLKLPYYEKKTVQTDRTNTNNTQDVTIRDSKQETCTLTGVAVPRHKCGHRRRRENFKTLRSHSRNSAHVKFGRKSYNGNNRDDWNHFKITRTILEQHTAKERKLRNYKIESYWATAQILREVL